LRHSTIACPDLCFAGSSTALPPMKMWIHQGTRDLFLFKEWVPNSSERRPPRLTRPDRRLQLDARRLPGHSTAPAVAAK
jgi:hypothetical protein